MKKLLIIFCFLTIIVFGCRYKEGPMINFRSVEKRLEGTWQIVGLTSDGIDSLQYYNDSCGDKMILRFNYPDGSPMSPEINFEGPKISFSGHFALSDNKKIMTVYIYDGFSINYWHLGPIGSSRITSYWKILKLTMNELKTSTDFNGRNYIISFKK